MWLRPWRHNWTQCQSNDRASQGLQYNIGGAFTVLPSVSRVSFSKANCSISICTTSIL